MFNQLFIAIGHAISSAFFGSHPELGGGGGGGTGRIELETGLGDLLLTESGDFFLLE
jgi:hypothetical protein